MTQLDDLSRRRAQLNPRQQALLASRLRGHAGPGPGPDAAPARPTIPRRAGDGPAPLSYAQQRLWFAWRRAPADTAYHLGAAIHLEGRLDNAALQAALDDVVARHPALRTVIAEDAGGQPVQRVQPAAPVALARSDLRARPAAEREAEADRLALTLAEAPFDLAGGPVLRAALIRVDEDDHRLVVVIHHIAGDAWSRGILLRDFAEAYAARCRGGVPAARPAPTATYADVAVWQRDWLAAGEAKRQLDHWTARLGAEHPVLALGGGRAGQLGGQVGGGARPATRRGDRHTVPLPPALVAALRARARGTGLFTVLLTAFLALLHRESGQADIRVGLPTANRHHAGTEEVVGLFVNTLVLRSELAGETTLADALARTRDAVLEAQANQDLPFERLVEALSPPRDAGRTPLFQVMFNHLKDDHRALESLPGLRLRGYADLRRAAQFDLTLETAERGDGRIDATVTYDADLFRPAAVAALAGRYARALDHLAHTPDRALHALDLLAPEERQEVERWSVNADGAGPFEPVHRLFERRAAARPEADALLFGDVRLSYGELNRRANRLAHRLRRLGVGPEVRVALALERSVELVVALLAVLKAGGAYVPLDPDYPAERLAHMLGDCGATLLLTHGAVRGRLPDAAVPVLDLDSLDVTDEPTDDPAVALHGETLAYVIYTSGSTGRPKGAGNRHSALHNRLAWMQRAYGLTSVDTVLQKTPFGFDVSVWEFLWPLAEGARLALATPGEHRDPVRLAATMRRHGVSVVHFVPSMLHAFLDHAGEVITGGACASLRHLVCSGEALPEELRRRTAERLPRVALHNLYGPTEAAIDVTHWTCVEEGGTAVPIGRPIAGVTTRILDAGLNVVPVGVAGELYLGGAGLGRGYLGRPGLTAERFVADPFDAAGGRLYRTGDLARWRADGAIEYLGRLDHQVKIRGMRIELGEIEARLLDAAGVREAVVVARPGPGGATLAGYVTARAGAAVDVEALRRHLAAGLPDHMVPAALTVLERLPLSPNGKLDRAALPAPDGPAGAAGGQPGGPPEGPLETDLAAIWAAVLGRGGIGRRDNFFALGGHSMLAMQVAARIHATLGLTVAIDDLFRAQTVADLAAHIQACCGDAPPPGAAQALHDLDAFIDTLES